MRKHNASFERYMAEHYPEALDRIVSWAEPDRQLGFGANGR
jgi:hypothetical protein